MHIINARDRERHASVSRDLPSEKAFLSTMSVFVDSYMLSGTRDECAGSLTRARILRKIDSDRSSTIENCPSSVPSRDTSIHRNEEKSRVKVRRVVRAENLHFDFPRAPLSFIKIDALKAGPTAGASLSLSLSLSLRLSRASP